MSPPALSHCALEVKQNDRDRFLASLFVPMPAREALLTVAALNIELKQIPDKVREEMIGHIRYAWWQENIEALYAGAIPRGQPVLQALAPLIAAGHMPKERLMALVENYRSRFPDPSPDSAGIVDTLCIHLLGVLCPNSEKGWSRAKTMITRHRERHGPQANGWLAFKLLLVGMY